MFPFYTFRAFLTHAQQMQDQPTDMSLSRNNAGIDVLSSTFTEKNIAFHPRCKFKTYYKIKHTHRSYILICEAIYLDPFLRKLVRRRISNFAMFKNYTHNPTTIYWAVF